MAGEELVFVGFSIEGNEEQGSEDLRKKASLFSLKGQDME